MVKRVYKLTAITPSRLLFNLFNACKTCSRFYILLFNNNYTVIDIDAYR